MSSMYHLSESESFLMSCTVQKIRGENTSTAESLSRWLIDHIDCKSSLASYLGDLLFESEDIWVRFQFVLRGHMQGSALSRPEKTLIKVIFQFQMLSRLIILPWDVWPREGGDPRDSRCPLDHAASPGLLLHLLPSPLDTWTAICEADITSKRSGTGPRRSQKSKSPIGKGWH